MTLDINYYFNHTERFPIPGFFDGIRETFEIFPRVKSVLDDMLTSRNVKDVRGEIRGEAPIYHGCYFIDEGTVIYNGVTIMGPVYIGRDCEIMPGAVIRPYSIIGDGCSIGHGSEVKRTVMMNGSKVASLSFAGDSILGVSARIGSGVITANRRFDQGSVSIRIAGERRDLGDTYFGCVLGDNSRMGANSVSQPGTHIGPFSWVYPITNVRGFIAKAKRVYNDQALVFEDNEIIELQ